MNNRVYRLEHALYALAFLLALFMRIIFLGRLPLSDPEANVALQALSLSEGGRVAFGSQSAYVLFTSVLFSIFNDTNFSARLLPALIGSLVIIIPFGLRDKLGRTASLIAAFGLAVDPGLVALSRMADSRILAMIFGLLAVVFYINKKPALMGCFAALTVLSGAAAWNFIIILGLGIGWLILNQMNTRQGKEERESFFRMLLQKDNPGWNWAKILIWFGGVLVLAGTLFFTRPYGIAFAVNGFIEYFRGWANASGVPITLLIISLFAYELLPLIFGVWGGIRGWIRSSVIDQHLMRWLGVALAVILIYPSRQVADMGWITLLLWLLAGRQIEQYSFHFHSASVPAWGQAAMTMVLLGFAAHHFLGVANEVAAKTGRAALEWIGVGGAVMLILIIFSGIAWGWGYQLALRGFNWAVLIMLAGFTLSAAWNAGGLGNNPGAELWRTSPLIKDDDIMIDTIESASLSATGFPTQADVRVVDMKNRALEWLLRTFPNRSVVTALPNNQSPAIVITDYQDQLNLAAEYSGQDFSWYQEIKWQSLLPHDWIRWLMLRKVPDNSTWMMVWVRSDLFPGNSNKE